MNGDWSKKNRTGNVESLKKKSMQQDAQVQKNYAAIDLGTNSCRLVIATPTPTSFRIVETFSRITRLGEGIINNNELSRAAIKRTVGALKVCAGVLAEYAPIHSCRYVATAACRRAKNFWRPFGVKPGLTLKSYLPRRNPGWRLSAVFRS